MTLTTSLICDHACEDAARDTIAMDTPLHRDPNNPQRPYPFHPGHYPFTSPRELRSDPIGKLPHSLLTWQLFTSHVKTLLHWSINCHRPSNKMMKILMLYHLPTLPKGWRYEDNVEEVKRELPDGPVMALLDHPFTTQHATSTSTGSMCHSKCLKTSRSTRETEQYPSPSPTSSVVPCPQDTSRFT